MAEALAGLLLEEGNPFLEIRGESALGILVALHHARRQGRWAGRRPEGPATQSPATRARMAALAPIVLGAAAFACSSLDPHDAHELHSAICDNSPMTWLCSTWPTRAKPVARPLERAGELERDEAALARSPSPEHKPRYGAFGMHRPHARDRRDARSPEARLRSRRCRPRPRPGLPQPRARGRRPRCRKWPPQQSSASGASRLGSSSTRQKRDEERGLLQLIDRVLRRINQRGDRGRRLGSCDRLTGVDRDRVGLLLDALARDRRSVRPPAGGHVHRQSRRQSAWRCRGQGRAAGPRWSAARCRCARSGARDRPQASRAPNAPNGLGAKPRSRA